VRVLIEFDNALGDVVTELPILHALRAALTSLSVEVVLKPQIAGLLEDYSYITRVHGREKTLRSRASPVTSSWQEPFDYHLYLRRHPAIKLSRILVRARTKIGAEGFDPSLNEVSAVRHRYSILRKMPFEEVPELRTAVELAPRRVLEARELAGIDGRARVVCVGPGAVAADRRWSKESFSQLLRGLEGHFDAMLLVGSSAERDLCGEVAAGTPAKNLAGGMHLTQLAALLSQAALYIGNDSGLSHLAAAQGCNAVSIGLQSDYYFPWRGFAMRGPCSEISHGDVVSFLREMSLIG
jgi:ADP-heptose:LPS heptosyltransferase